MKRLRFFRGMIALLLVLPLCSCSLAGSLIANQRLKDESSAGPAASDQISLSRPVRLARRAVGAAGGTLSFEPDGKGFPGMTLSIPENALPDQTPLELSYRLIKGHALGGTFNPLTPLIQIDMGDIFAEAPITVTIPVAAPEDHFAMPFYLDPVTMAFKGIPLIDQDEDSMTFMVSHFSSIVISSLLVSLLLDEIETDFTLEADTWSFPNHRTWWAPEGMLNGMTIGALYYHQILKPRYGSLAGRFDNSENNFTTPGFWLDDIDAIRLCSLIHPTTLSHSNVKDPNRTIYYTSDRIGPSMSFYNAKYAMMRSGQPQLMYTAIDHHGESLHLFYLVYQADATRLFLYDPQTPRNNAMYLEFDIEQAVNPVSLVVIPDTDPVKISFWLFLGDASVIHYGRLTDIWTGVLSDRLPSGGIPDYHINVMETDASGRQEETPFIEEYLTTASALTMALNTRSFSGRISLYDESGRIVGEDNGHGQALINLEPGRTRIGILVESLQEGHWRWTDFRWYWLERTASGAVSVTPEATATATPGPTGQPSEPATLEFAGSRWKLTMKYDTLDLIRELDINFFDDGSVTYINHTWQAEWQLDGQHMAMNMQYDYKSGPNMVVKVEMNGTVTVVPDGDSFKAEMRGEFKEWNEWEKDKSMKTGTWSAVYKGIYH